MGRAFNHHVKVLFDADVEGRVKDLGINPADAFVFQSAREVASGCKEVRLSVIAQSGSVLDTFLTNASGEGELQSRSSGEGERRMELNPEFVELLRQLSRGGLQVLGCCSKSRDVEVLLVGEHGVDGLVNQFFLVEDPEVGQADEKEIKRLKVTRSHSGSTSCR